MEKTQQRYGICFEKHPSPVQVRDAIIQCFYEAHKDILEQVFSTTTTNCDEQKESQKYKHVEMLIRKMFRDVNEEFNRPTKQSLLKVIDKCAAYAQNFRDQDIISHHYKEMKDLIDQIK